MPTAPSATESGNVSGHPSGSLLSVLIGKMRVCRLNWMIGEVMERALVLESEKPEVQP